MQCVTLSSLLDSWHYPCSAKNVKEIAAPSKMCFANEKLEEASLELREFLVLLFDTA